jgi:hypothetical protein
MPTFESDAFVFDWIVDDVVAGNFYIKRYNRETRKKPQAGGSIQNYRFKTFNYLGQAHLRVIYTELMDELTQPMT